MYVLLRQQDTMFAINEEYIDKFTLSRYFYSINLTPQFILGFENIKSTIYPIINIFGFIETQEQYEKPEYLIKIKEPLNFLFYSTLKPNIVNFENKPTIDTQDILKPICNLSYKYDSNIINVLDIKKITNLLRNYQKNGSNGDEYA